MKTPGVVLVFDGEVDEPFVSSVFKPSITKGGCGLLLQSGAVPAATSPFDQLFVDEKVCSQLHESVFRYDINVGTCFEKKTYTSSFLLLHRIELFPNVSGKCNLC
jgi:hypothetical protein